MMLVRERETEGMEGNRQERKVSALFSGPVFTTVRVWKENGKILREEKG
jgi:hypothetical protein